MSSAPSLKDSSVFEPQFVGNTDAPANPRASARTKYHDRICIAIPVEVVGTDLNGQTFRERTKTEHVSRSGACLVLNRLLGPDQQIKIRRAGDKAETIARIVGQVGIRKNGYVFGISLLTNEGSSFWGVHFPPTSAQPTDRLLRCTCCHKAERIVLNEIECGVLEANGILSRSCEECKAATFWQAVASEQPSAALGASDTQRERKIARKSIRMSMKASACISLPNGARDIAAILDVSRGGVAFRSSTDYPIHSWVELAAPYTEGGANIFVAGRIVWQRSTAAGFCDYGVQYVKN
jgi:PilZ domain